LGALKCIRCRHRGDTNTDKCLFIRFWCLQFYISTL